MSEGGAGRRWRRASQQTEKASVTSGRARRDIRDARHSLRDTFFHSTHTYSSFACSILSTYSTLLSTLGFLIVSFASISPSSVRKNFPCRTVALSSALGPLRVGPSFVAFGFSLSSLAVPLVSCLSAVLQTPSLSPAPATPPRHAHAPDSSLGSLGTIDDDLSAYDPNFFSGVDALRAPDPDNLQMPGQQTPDMPAWAYMPSGGFPENLSPEELAEIRADPSAADDSVMDEDEDEEDELDPSPALPSPSLGRRRPLDLNQRPVHPLRFSSPPVEPQSGGRPSPQGSNTSQGSPAHCVCSSKINLTACALGNEKAKSMHAHRNESANQPNAPPPPSTSIWGCTCALHGCILAPAAFLLWQLTPMVTALVG
ncbi:hypothetical protein DFH07DRAFT_955963 [Mycena maculata]|uniref:Uncharacterized protein n=1 Tax=Mycena maculata TaxID=230809 RepID=A0AAD7NKP6_9AGAR|nr:hypothetical protein DFH07DRAFT_955963 [Mycena maculata]